MKCQACEREIDLPFRCSYCGGGFCSDHRLPENHACPRIEQARAERQGQVMQQQGYGNYSYSYVYGQVLIKNSSIFAGAKRKSSI